MAELAYAAEQAEIDTLIVADGSIATNKCWDGWTATKGYKAVKTKIADSAKAGN
jgi:hypothetical protein